MEKLEIKKNNWKWYIVIEKSYIVLDCFREIDTCESLQKIEKVNDVPEWYICFDFYGLNNNFQATYKDWVVYITN